MRSIQGAAPARTSVTYEESPCKTALNRVQGMGFRWSLNPYLGCVHGCHYCYARRYHAFRELDAGADFSSIVFVRTGIEAVLRRELRRSSWKREEVALGTATDPYQPIEGRHRLTRGCLHALADHLTPVGVVTKGTLVVRDNDILSQMTESPGCTVTFSLTTLDPDLWTRLEPGTSPPRQRLRALERLVREGVCAGVLLAPVLPGLTEVDLVRLWNWTQRLGLRMVGLTPSRMDDQRTVTEVKPVPGFHASGHAGQPELVEFVRRARPEVLIPIHTDAAHLWVSLLEGTGVKVALPEYARPLEVG